MWKWDGSQWIENILTPPSYHRKQGNGFVMAPTEAGKWETIEQRDKRKFSALATTATILLMILLTFLFSSVQKQAECQIFV